MAARAACVLAAAGLTLAVAAAAGAANLREVRIGNHPGKTRVVLETNGAAAYRVVSRSGSEIVIRLDADAVPEAKAGNGNPLLWVRVEPRIGGTDVRLELSSAVGLEEMVLTDPDRVVLDLIPGAAAAATTTEPAPPPSVAEPEPAPAVVAEATPTAPAEPAVAEPAQEHPEAGGPLAAAGSQSPPLKDDAAPGSDGHPVAEPEPPKHRLPPAPAPRAKSRSGSPLAILGNPIVLAAIGLVIVLLGVWAVRRRSSATEEDFADDDTAAPSTDAAPESLTSFASADAPSGSGAVAEASPEPAGSLFDVDEAEVVAAPEPESPASAAPAAVAPLDTSELGDDMAAIVQEIERRMAHLETRLEEVVDAKERLERQVAAQTEELRVQRAAIARTQRVLRGIARPEDEATEPAPK